MLRYFSYPPLYKVSFEIFLSNFNWAGTTGFDLTWSYRERISFERGLPGQFSLSNMKRSQYPQNFHCKHPLKIAQKDVCRICHHFIFKVNWQRNRHRNRNWSSGKWVWAVWVCSVICWFVVQWFADLLPTAEKQNVQISHISISEWRFYFHAIEQTS